jgi:hypothetical protein
MADQLEYLLAECLAAKLEVLMVELTVDKLVELKVQKLAVSMVYQ